MRLRRIVVLFVTLALALGTVVAGPHADAAGYRHKKFKRHRQPAHWIAGYYPGYQSNLMPTSEITWSSLTHIIFGPVIPHADGSLDLSMDMDSVTGPAKAKEIALAAKAHHVQALLMIGGAFTHDDFMSAITNHKKSFVKKLYQAMDKLKFTGVDLDLEPLNDADQRAFLSFVKALKRFDRNVTITFPAEITATTFAATDAPRLNFIAHSLARFVTKVGIQTYNMAGPYPGWESGPFAPLFVDSTSADCSHACIPTSVDYNIQTFLAAGLPASKLMIGLGFYGACWNPETGPDQALKGDGTDIVASDNDMSYANIENDYRSLMTYSYDSTFKEAQLSNATAVGPKGCTWISFEDPASIADKGSYARTKGLGGAMIWTIPQGHLNGQDALLTDTHTAFVP